MSAPAIEYFCEKCSAIRFSPRCRECGSDDLEQTSNLEGAAMSFVKTCDPNTGAPVTKHIYPGPAPIKCQISGRPIVDVFVEGKVHGRGDKWLFMDEAAHDQYGVGLGFRSGLKYRKDRSGWWRRVGDYEDK